MKVAVILARITIHGPEGTEAPTLERINGAVQGAVESLVAARPSADPADEAAAAEGVQVGVSSERVDR